MKEPITSRTILFDTLRDGTKVRLDWNLVDTPQGGMLEPRSIGMVNAESVNSIDAFDEGFTKFQELDEDVMQELFNTGGCLFFRTYNPY